jgi:hypothetical protein
MTDKPAYPEADNFWKKHDDVPYTGGDSQGAKIPPFVKDKPGTDAPPT